jgi:hypothetical protein
MVRRDYIPLSNKNAAGNVPLSGVCPQASA